MSTSTHTSGVRSYVIGFVSSLILTLDAFVLVYYKLLSGWTLVYAIVGLATVQLVAQLVFFLHISHGAKPRWQAIAFWFMVLVVCILGAGSVWIMQNIDYHHEKMTPSESELFITEDEGIRP